MWRWHRMLLAGLLIWLAALSRAGGQGEVPAARKLSPRVAAGEPAAGYVVIFHPGFSRDDARAAVSDSGLTWRDHPDLPPNQALATGPETRAKVLATRSEVTYIMPASTELLAGEHVVACAGPAVLETSAAEYVTAGGWPRPASGEVALMYVLGVLTSKLSEGVAQEEIVRAFREWERWGNLHFSPGDRSTGDTTLYVFFAQGAHGDAYPFDGRGKTLAHTFYPAPPNPEPIAGDIHMDMDEDWHAGAMTDLYSVVLHETGHALGLGHSDRPGAVMYPYYSINTTLTDDDVAGLKDLYGTRGAAPAPGASLALVVVEPPAATFTTTATSMVIRGTAQVRVTPVEITWTSDRAAGGRALGTLSWSIAAAPLSLGTNVFTITATDAVGTHVSVLLTVLRQNVPAAPPAADTTPPALRITSPAKTIVAVFGAAITLRGTAGDNVAVASVTWSNSTGGAAGASGTAAWSANVPVLVGTNVITVRAFDAAGNTSWRSVTVVRR